MMLFSTEQSILAEETLANLWSFAKSANVSTLQSFPPYGISQVHLYDILVINTRPRLCLGFM